MADGEFKGRARPGRYAHNNRFPDIEAVEQREMRIRLCSWRCVQRNRRTEISEARRRNDPKVIAYEIADVRQPLIVTAARTMDGKKWEAVAPVRILDRPRGGVDDATSATDGVPCVRQFMAIWEIA